jgi:hypothetical protein
MTPDHYLIKLPQCSALTACLGDSKQMALPQSRMRFTASCHGSQPLCVCCRISLRVASATSPTSGLRCSASTCLRCELTAVNAQAVKTEEAEQEQVEEEEEPMAQELYCLCRQPDDPKAPRNFVACDKCEQWFHPECVDTTLEVCIFAAPATCACPSRPQHDSCLT